MKEVRVRKVVLQKVASVQTVVLLKVGQDQTGHPVTADVPKGVPVLTVLRKVDLARVAKARLALLIFSSGLTSMKMAS